MLSLKRRSPKAANARGSALMVVMVTALFSAVAVYIVLFMTFSESAQSKFYRLRLPAQSAAEAGIIWAQQRLWVNPSYCGFPDPPPMNGFTVNVTMTNCGTPTPTIHARVDY
ncbi:MAG: hypothetical protein HYZ91_07245 [Candidatus Omnitrophica bacterium]|nr:hypothetical protein [Candidatus Omnitrophota bacterium]